MEDVTTWAGLWEGLKALALFVAVASFGMLAWTVKGLTPMVLAYMQERMVAFAQARLGGTIAGRAAAIADPANAATSVMAEAKQIAANAPLAMANSGSTVEGVASALQSAVSQIRLGLAPAPAAPPAPPAPVSVLRP